jgi:chromate transporter
VGLEHERAATATRIGQVNDRELEPRRSDKTSNRGRATVLTAGRRRLRGRAGVLVGTTYLVGKEAIGDWLTIAIAVVSLAVIIAWKKLPEPFVVLAGGLIGLLTYQHVKPEWVLR